MHVLCVPACLRACLWDVRAAPGLLPCPPSPRLSQMQQRCAWGCRLRHGRVPGGCRALAGRRVRGVHAARGARAHAPGARHLCHRHRPRKGGLWRRQLCRQAPANAPHIICLPPGHFGLQPPGTGARTPPGCLHAHVQLHIGAGQQTSNAPCRPPQASPRCTPRCTTRTCLVRCWRRAPPSG